MKAGESIVRSVMDESGNVFSMTANIRAVIPREEGRDLVVLGPMFISGRPASFIVVEDGYEYEVIPT